MPPYTQANRPLKITTPLGTDVFGVLSISGAEAISQPFEYRVEVFAAADAVVEFDRLLGQGVTVTVVLADGGKRHVHGIVRSVAKGGTERLGAEARTAYRLVVVPKLWLLTRASQSRIFQQKTVKQILETVLTGLTTQFSLQGQYEPRDYCAQYRETDFDFASRLMEEEGIYYYFVHTESDHKMVVSDVPSTHPALPAGATITFDPGVGGALPDDRVHEWEKSQDLTSGKVTLWDASFELPGRNLEATAQVSSSVQVGAVSHKLRYASNQALELYDYPGGYAHRFDGVAPGGGDAASNLQKVFQDNRRTAGVRAQQVELGAVVIHGSSDCRQLASGHRFTLQHHPDADGEYVITAVEHEARAADSGRSGGSMGFAYRNRFRCIPAALAFRAPRATPRPRVDGCQTAVVVGPQGEEIFTDKYGRVKVQFHWDRQGRNDQNSSCWVRVASIWAGNKWGAVHIPRIGQEVVVDFLEGDPDQPIIVGSVYNANQMPPYTLPDNRTQSGIKSRSSLQGTPETFNEIRFEDKKDSEQVYVQAQKDLDTKVKHNETRLVWNDRTTTISNNDTRTVGGKDKDGNDIGGNDAVTVTKGDRAVKVTEGSLTTTVGKDQSTTIAENDTFSAGKNQTIDVGEARTETVGKDESVSVAGKRTVDIGKDDALTVGKKLTIEAADEIVLKTGQSTLTLKKDGTVQLNGKDIKLTGMASVQLKAPQVKIAADGQFEAKAAMVKVEGQGMLQLKAPMSQVNGDGMLMLKGGLAMVN